jgi:hypothetical protein
MENNCFLRTLKFEMGSPNFIIFGPTDQKLWGNKNLRKSLGRAGMY